MSCLWFKTNC